VLATLSENGLVYKNRCGKYALAAPLWGELIISQQATSNWTMSPHERFLDPATVSLKICGVTTLGDAERLVARGVDALGVNFWPRSKRYLAPEEAAWLTGLAGNILRVGVFVNEAPELPLRLMRDGLLDAVQLHGDETPEDAAAYQEAGVPFFKAIGVKTLADLARAADFRADAILLDAHAPGLYGGTGETFDWSAALDFKMRHPEIPIILAGGITPENVAIAAAAVHPAALDVASGAELSPGIKDFHKVDALLAALKH
jgi:phosphoribosylanthranilate isomerase